MSAASAGWQVVNGTWTAADHTLVHTTSQARIDYEHTESDFELWFSYVCNDASDAGFYAAVQARRRDNGDHVSVWIKPGRMPIEQVLDNTRSSLAPNAPATSPGGRVV